MQLTVKYDRSFRDSMSTDIHESMWPSSQMIHQDTTDTSKDASRDPKYPGRSLCTIMLRQLKGPNNVSYFDAQIAHHDTITSSNLDRATRVLFTRSQLK
jgi:hypothetical protein